MAGGVPLAFGALQFVADIAEAMDIQITRVHRLMDDGSLLEVRRPEDRVRVVPAAFTATRIGPASATSAAAESWRCDGSFAIPRAMT